MDSCIAGLLNLTLTLTVTLSIISLAPFSMYAHAVLIIILNEDMVTD